jgi:thiol-disulfide isomerase/thioredoxin
LENVADDLYQRHIVELASALGRKEVLTEIEVYQRLRIGAPAPEIKWSSGSEMHSLGDLPESENYLLVFWSSTCSHCLNELPKLHTALMQNQKFSVLAIGLEEDDSNWKKEAARFPNFKHAISLGKWESEYAGLYAIQQTPTYLVLDKDKKILAKPVDYEDLLLFINVTSP